MLILSFPLSISESIPNTDLFDPNNRPYTPSYNSVGDFSDVLSDQQEFLQSIGEQIDGIDFAFDDQSPGIEKAAVIPSFHYDPDTADSYNHLNAALLSQSVLTDQRSGRDSQKQQNRQSTITPANVETNSQNNGVPTFAFSNEAGYREARNESIASPIASPLLGPSQSPLHTRTSSFGSSAEFSSPNGEGDPAIQQMQTLGQRMTINDSVLVSHPSDSSRLSNEASSQKSQLQAPYFAPVFEEDGTEVGNADQQNASFPSYTYSLPSHDPTAVPGAGNDAPVPMLSINDSSVTYEQNQHGQSGSSSARGFQFPSKSQQQWMVDGANASQSFMNSDNQAAPYAALANQQAALGSNQQRPSSSTGEAHQQQDPKRQDSYDRVRKFLRLDVDMGFQAERDSGSVNETGPRKRSNSDFGLSYKEDGVLQGDDIPSPPPYAVVPGGVSDKTPIAMQSGVDWATEAAKQRRMQQLAALGLQDGTGHGQNFEGIQNSINNASMDPLLLQKQQQQQQQHADNMYHQQMLQYQQNPASGPVRQRESLSGRGSAAPYPGHGRTASSGSLASVSSGGHQMSFQNAQQQGTQLSDLQRSHSGRSAPGGRRHSRLAQSEDLSQLARMSNPHEFLTRITAPDGGLAPPNTQPGMASMGPPTSATNRNGLSRIDTGVPAHAGFSTAPHLNLYGAQYPRSQEELQAMMNRYGSMRYSPSDQVYSQTDSPAYAALHPSRVQDMGASPYEMDGTNTTAIPIVQQVTTSATQAASASRRKNEAIHVCPIPGCGSTFTRKFNLNGHIRSHTGQRPYQCRAPGCGKSFARSFDLSRHEKLHAGVKPHTCESCGKAFARADALSRHLRNDAGAGGCAQRLSESENGTIEGDQGSPKNISIHEMGGVELGSMFQTNANSFEQEINSANATADTVAGSTAMSMRKEGRFKGHVL